MRFRHGQPIMQLAHHSEAGGYGHPRMWDSSVQPESANFSEAHQSKGYYQFAMAPLTSNVNVVGGYWLDSKKMAFLSTAHTGQAGEVLRHRKGHRGRLAVRAPLAMVDYNDKMHGVDVADQMRVTLSVLNRSRKWWKPVFSWLVDTAVTNAYRVYQSRYACDVE